MEVHGELQIAFARLDRISPGKAEVKITNSDNNPHRYGVTLWNCFGKWFASEETLAQSINRAIDLAEEVNFNLKT